MLIFAPAHAHITLADTLRFNPISVLVESYLKDVLMCQNCLCNLLFDKNMNTYIYITTKLYRMSQELRSLFWDLIPELILSQKGHKQMGPIRRGLGVMIF